MLVALLDSSLAQPTTPAIKTNAARISIHANFRDMTQLLVRKVSTRTLLNPTHLACLPQVHLWIALHLAEATLAAEVQWLIANEHFDGIAHSA